jgi:hypothetical protein
MIKLTEEREITPYVSVHPDAPRHGVLLVLSAPCQLLVLAGPEHGRTIPLADIGVSAFEPTFTNIRPTPMDCGNLGCDTPRDYFRPPHHIKGGRALSKKLNPRTASAPV